MNLNLKGLKVLNTRPKKQARKLSLAIEAAGGEALEFPAIEIQPTNSNWFTHLPNLDKVAKAVFISANAAHYCFEVLQQKKCLWPKTIEVIAVGEATSFALKSHGIKAHLVPSISDSENLLKLPELRYIDNKIILLFKGVKGRTLIAETLKHRGANLYCFEVYTRQLPTFTEQELHSFWHNKHVDIILFTSQQSMQNLFILFGEKAHTWLRHTPCLVISKRLAAEAALLGIEKILISDPKTIVTTLQQFNEGLIHGQ
ncbi:MAG: uroporphyrinogen-III synthase [Tatlockia sp.]|nr:uroporphyrinogen-III synthase [Tatlockia sp.]